MDIVIAGDGEVGFHLAKILRDRDHNITIVDPHKDLLNMLESYADLLTITGDSTSISVLEQANVKNADLLLSVVHDEKINIITCTLGKKMGAKRTIARVNNAEYLTPKSKEFFKTIGIDELVGTERIAANEIVNLLNSNAATEVFSFSDGKLLLMLLRLNEKTKVVGRTLDDIAREYPDLDFRAVAIHRKGKTIIPRGYDTFESGDLTYLITRQEGVSKLLDLSGKQPIKIKNVMIIGGGRIGRKTARSIEKDIRVKLIEIDQERCNSLTDSLDKDTLLIHGDARDVKLLEEEGIRGTDAFIAVTNDTETNIFTCLLAKKYGVPIVIPLIENIDYIDITQTIGIDTFINKKLITASHIARFTMRTEVCSMKWLNGVDAEVLELVAKKGSLVTKKVIRKLNMPDEAIIGGIIREKRGYIAIGDFQIREGDKVVVFVQPEGVTRIEKLFGC